ncbi:hypothetical protein [Sorangium sp. So ce362]|uniref:hypothetical protein n=1 Tax=Sorangium sp. So ce362 TaxID=3133303 RepID=UPI003F5FCF28
MWCVRGTASPATGGPLGAASGRRAVPSRMGAGGACEDQVLPGEEDCDERGEEDCDGVGCSEVVWARIFGTGPLQ